jgi:hypothetical protein
MSPKDLPRSRASRSPEEAVLEAIRVGYRDRDVVKVMSAYAEDIESTIVNRNNPPSRPLVLRGRAALQRMVEDIRSREMSHQTAMQVVGRHQQPAKNILRHRHRSPCRHLGASERTLRCAFRHGSPAELIPFT